MTTLTLSNSFSANQNESVHSNADNAEMKEVASVILGGGEGTRLHPFTLTRCKPAVNFGGKYLLIDVPISNSIHAGCSKIFVLTQFLSTSLHHHIFQTYVQGGKISHQIEILAAEQKPKQKSWFQGTADAVRQNINYLLESPAEYYLILSGDQLYNINFRKMLSFAKSKDADVVVAALPVTAQDASRMGILQINSHQHIVNFHEKPQDIDLLNQLISPPSILEQAGLSEKSNRNYLGSMGIYLFKRKALVNLLKKDLREDFGKHLIPTQVAMGNIAAFIYDGYWEDIGTVETFYQANMALTTPNSPFQLYNEIHPIFSCHYDLPPAQFFDTQIKRTILCEGCLIAADEISNSILGPRSVVGKGSIIRDSYLMGNDFYESPLRDHDGSSTPSIGEDCVISRTIIDKNATIGKKVQLVNKHKLVYYDYDDEKIFIRDGVIIVSRGAKIPDGFIL